MVSILLETTQCYAEPENKKGLLHQAKFLFRAIRQWPYTHHWFRFLTEQAERPRADIPSNKRAQYQRRHHLEAELRQQLAAVWEDDCLAS